MNVLLQGSATEKSSTREQQKSQSMMKTHWKHCPTINSHHLTQQSRFECPSKASLLLTQVELNTDVLAKFAQQDSFQLFMCHSERLRPAYSPQVLPLMKTLGTIIGHSFTKALDSHSLLHSYSGMWLLGRSRLHFHTHLCMTSLQLPQMLLLK